MTVRAKLKDLAPGTVFNAGPIDVRVLEHFADGRTLLIEIGRASCRERV